MNKVSDFLKSFKDDITFHVRFNIVMNSKISKKELIEKFGDYIVVNYYTEIDNASIDVSNLNSHGAIINHYLDITDINV